MSVDEGYGFPEDGVFRGRSGKVQVRRKQGERPSHGEKAQGSVRMRLGFEQGTSNTKLLIITGDDLQQGTNDSEECRRAEGKFPGKHRFGRGGGVVAAQWHGSLGCSHHHGLVARKADGPRLGAVDGSQPGAVVSSQGCLTNHPKLLAPNNTNVSLTVLQVGSLTWVSLASNQGVDQAGLLWNPEERLLLLAFFSF